jgi:hypothetical protein
MRWPASGAPASPQVTRAARSVCQASRRGSASRRVPEVWRTCCNANSAPIFRTSWGIAADLESNFRCPVAAFACSKLPPAAPAKVQLGWPDRRQMMRSSDSALLLPASLRRGALSCVLLRENLIRSNVSNRLSDCSLLGCSSCSCLRFVRSSLLGSRLNSRGHPKGVVRLMSATGAQDVPGGRWVAD